jgi:ABC-type polysaccharide/polyol phosphate transport system ATPase subunit
MASIVLENIRVDFPIYATQRNLRSAIFHRATGGLIRREGKNQNRVVVTALSGVSMTLQDGDRIGLIGHNGSGKSTLLKVIAGIYEPIEGRLTVEGAVTPLFDMMPGLDPEDNAYENILTAGLLLGLSREEIESRIPQIEEQSELGEYLSLPVRTYSAGMMMRLGFSLVTSVEPGILLMDEGFGTGDARFAQRAEQRLNDFIGRSRILVLASHSDRTIRAMCNKAALLQEGRLLAVGPVDEVCEQYYALVRAAIVATDSVPGKSADDRPKPTEPTRFGAGWIRDANLGNRLARASGAVRVTRAVAKDMTGATCWTFLPGDTAKFVIEYEVMSPVPDLILLFRLLHRAGGQDDQVVTDIYENLSTVRLEKGHTGAVELTFPNLRLTPNQLFVYVWLGRMDCSISYDVVDANVAMPFLEIRSGPEKKRTYGLVSLQYECKPVEPSIAGKVVESEPQA